MQNLEGSASASGSPSIAIAAAAASAVEAEPEFDDGASESGMSEATRRSRKDRMKGAMSGAKGKLASFGRRKKGEKELDIPPAQAEAEERAAERCALLG